MIEVLEYVKREIAEPPLPPVKAKRRENPKRKLTSLYVLDNRRYEIDCISLKNWTVMKFSHPELGDVLFERESASLIQTSMPMDKHYFTHLKRAINQWKMQFPDF